MLDLRGYAFVRDILRSQLATQDTRHVRTFNELLNGLDQSSRLKARSQAEHRASRFRQTKLRELVCSLDVVEALCLRSSDFGDVQMHGNSDKTLRERIVDLSSHPIALFQNCRLLRSLCQPRKADSESGLMS
jgi:hypothetical protein